MTIEIAPLRDVDRAAWEPLARGYKAFYETELPDSRYEETWRLLIADERIHGLAAWIDGRMAGIAHYFLHAQTWSADICYLQDLFTAEDMRGHGVATALIQSVAEAARARGAVKYYWMTKEDNHTARALYDRVASFKGFIRYDYLM
jgi:GNAT superfamily N-acetyltransferase